MKLPSKKMIYWTLIGLAILVLAYFFVGWPRLTKNAQYGITWSKPYAESLGLDSQQGLTVMLKDVGVQKLRLPAYWSLLEKTQGQFDFSWLDAQLGLAQQYGGHVTLALGARLPRWPECWTPDWVTSLSPAERRAAQLEYIRQVYNHYSEHPAIERWQIENEASFTFFASCPGLTKDLINEEITLVRGLEQSRPMNQQRPVITTDSGEWSTWLSFAGKIDGKGVSVYRRVTNPWIGIISYWFIPPWFYQRKAMLAQSFVGDILVSEFQMEPWADVSLPKLDNPTLFQTLDLKQMQSNLWYAEHMGFKEVYFWGAEWWLWMKENRDQPQFMDAMTQFFHSKR